MRRRRPPIKPSPRVRRRRQASLSGQAVSKAQSLCGCSLRLFLRSLRRTRSRAVQDTTPPTLPSPGLALILLAISSDLPPMQSFCFHSYCIFSHTWSNETFPHHYRSALSGRSSAGGGVGGGNSTSVYTSRNASSQSSDASRNDASRSLNSSCSHTPFSRRTKCVACGRICEIRRYSAKLSIDLVREFVAAIIRFGRRRKNFDDQRRVDERINAADLLASQRAAARR